MALKQPSNSDILKAVKEIQDMQLAQAKSIEQLQLWKVSEDAYRAALSKVKGDEAQAKYDGLRDNELKRRTELIKQVGIVVGLVLAILYAYAVTHGIKT